MIEYLRKKFGKPWMFAPFLALIIFLIDTFTSIESAIAVLYVLVLLLVAKTLSRRGIIVVAIICAGLTVISFLVSHGFVSDLSSLLRLCVSLAAILITGALLLRDDASHIRLLNANDALKRSEWRFRSIFELARVSLWEQDYTKVYVLLENLRSRGITDLASYAEQHPDFYSDLAELIITTNVNEATLELLGASSNNEVLGSLKPFIPPAAEGFLRVIQALFDGHDRFEGKTNILGVDGKVRTILIGIRFPDDAADYRRVVANLVDITKREQTQEALLAAQAELARTSRAATVGALSASIAHELNQPLAALLMNAQTCLRWIRRAPPNFEAATKAAERTVRDGERASAIVQKTRAMLVKSLEHAESIDLYQLSGEVKELLEWDLTLHSVDLKIDCAHDVAKVRANRVDMQQVLVNLIMNGIQAMADCPPSTRRIEIEIVQSNIKEVRLTVKDRGKGIGSDNLTSLFDPFFTTKQNGMGMGLAISRSTIEAHGGRLTARNQEDGGAVFEFVVPSIFGQGV